MTDDKALLSVTANILIWITFDVPPFFQRVRIHPLLDLLLFSWDKLCWAPLPRSVSFSVKLMQISSLCLSNVTWCRALAPSRCAGVIVTFYLVILVLTGCRFRLIPQLPPPVRADHTWQWIETSERTLLHFVSSSFTHPRTWQHFSYVLKALGSCASWWIADLTTKKKIMWWDYVASLRALSTLDFTGTARLWLHPH